MKLEVGEKSNLVLSEFYFPIIIENFAKAHISCADNGFEITYEGKFIELKEGEIIVTDLREKLIDNVLKRN
jgi:hypothetical protein